MLESEILKVMALYRRAETFRHVPPVSSKDFDLLVQDLKPYPYEIIRESIEQARGESMGVYFCPALVLDKVKAVMELYPDFNPAKQWALVRQQLQGDSFCSLKVLFDNVRTNLAIEAMGGQKELLNNYTETGAPFLRKEFIENYRKAVIMPGLNWRIWIAYDPDRYRFIRQGTVNLIGCSVAKEISENEADRLFVEAVNTKQGLLTQNVLAISQGE